MDAGSGRLERAADRIYLILGIYRDKMPNEAVEALQGVAAALGAAQEPAQEPVDTLCLFCRTELDPDEMDDGSDLPPLAPGVCSECFQRWHDEPVWRKRLKEAADKPAQAGEAVARAAAIQAVVLCYERSRTGAPILCDAPEIVEAAAAHALRTHQNGGA